MVRTTCSATACLCKTSHTCECLWHEPLKPCFAAVASFSIVSYVVSMFDHPSEIILLTSYTKMNIAIASQRSTNVDPWVRLDITHYETLIAAHSRTILEKRGNQPTRMRIRNQVSKLIFFLHVINLV